MSDEQPPPSLRLKPRGMPPPPVDDPLPPVPPPEPAAASDAAVEPSLADPFRLRLKPKTPPPEGATVDTSGLGFATPQPFSTPPIAPVNQGPASAESVPPPADPLAVAPRGPSAPPPVSLMRPQHLQTPRSIIDPGASAANPDAQATYRADKWLAGIALFVLLLVGAFYGVRYLMKENPKPKTPAKVAPAPAEQKTPPPTKPHLVDAPVSAAGKAIAKARDIVAAQDKRQEGVENVLDETPATANAKPSGAAVSPSAGQPAASQTTAGSAAAVQPALPAPPSDAFRAFVVNMHVNGVFQGENARAMLNGKLYNPGDLVDAKLGVSLIKIDVDAKELIFRDTGGATMTRRY